MFGKKEKVLISAYTTREFIELLYLRLMRGENLVDALSSIEKSFRFPPNIFELLEVDADILITQLDKYSGHFILLCAILQDVKHENTFRILDALALLKVKMIDLLYTLDRMDIVIFHHKSLSPKQYAREMLKIIN